MSETPEHHRTLDGLRFDNRFTADLPADPSLENHPRPVPSAAFSRVTTRQASAPKLVAWSDEVLDLLGLDPAVVDDPRFLEVFVGNATLAGMDLHAARYGGHQFGHWADQLGDGRAIVLGEVVGGPGGRQTLQLKGAGPTPYSRRADGLAVLRSSVREFLCSEAMHHLGVPTTRALSLCTTGDEVLRDMFYDGHPELEPGAVVCRVAPSFLRFGNYEIAAAHGERELLEKLVDHTFDVHFPHLEGSRADKVLAFYREVVASTADLVVHWQRVGFVHGVMNTDNMSIHGVTIDYGPYGWLEDYDPAWTPNTTDAQMRRYAFGNQPRMAQWNVAKLGNALAPLVDDVSALQGALDGYADRFQSGWNAMMTQKLGLAMFDADTDPGLFEALFQLLTKAETDVTLFFRGLAEVPSAVDASEDDQLDPLRDSYYQPVQLNAEHRAATLAWLGDYRARLRKDGRDDAERAAAMSRVNPLYVMRNYLAQLAIDDAAKGDFAGVRDLLDVMRVPYDEQPGRAKYAEKRPDWARSKPGCSQLSCSS